jgi:hypothetical protein
MTFGHVMFLPGCDALVEKEQCAQLPDRLLSIGPVAGWDLHQLESAAFSRRTPIADKDI